MRKAIPIALCLGLCSCLSQTAFADGASLDVAPTTLELKSGEAGLFYVTNHGSKPVTVQIEAMDWQQRDNQDALAPSETLFTSPPLARISPGSRQSIRVLARTPGDGSESSYRLRVSELPDPGAAGTGVQVLLQFSVPVFVNHDPAAAPLLAWSAARDAGGVTLSVRNSGKQTVKLTRLALGGAALGGDAFVYVLPGATHRFAAMPAASGALHVSARDARSGRDLAFDLASPP